MLCHYFSSLDKKFAEKCFVKRVYWEIVFGGKSGRSKMSHMFLSELPLFVFYL